MINEIKLAIIAVVAGITSWLGILATPIYILLLVMLIDYGTGLASAWIAGTLNSKEGALGIIKKVGYGLLVVAGGVVDIVIDITTKQLGIDYKFPLFFALIVTLWLVLNELISILENLVEIGVPIPPFLNKIVSKLKGAIESKGDVSA